MPAEDIFTQVSDALTEELGIPTELVRQSATLADDLEMDSLDRVEFLAILEGRFGRRIDANAIEQVRTVQDVVDVIHAELAAESWPTGT